VVVDGLASQAILAAMKRVELPCGAKVAALGQGTWNVGDDPARRDEEIAAIRLGIDLGLTLIDTAEMYGDGRSETLVGEAIAGRRDEVFLVTKVYPHHALRRAMQAACNDSLRRLRVEAIDLYLLHWPGDVPLDETVQAFEALQRAGKIRQWGVSNFDSKLIESLHAVPGGNAAQTDQVLYHLAKRGIEWDLLPWCRERRIPIMAYSPFDQGPLLRKKALAEVARRHGVAAATVALAWIMRHKDMIVIPKAAKLDHVRANHAALNLKLTDEDLADLDAAFAPPEGPKSLEMA